MVEQIVVIQNKYGLHARPAAKFVEIAARFNADVTIAKDGIEVNGKSIMGVLMLAAEKGSKLCLKINGPDENAAVKELMALLDGKFNEE